MLSPVTRGQKSLIRTAECLEFFKHPFEMRDDAKRAHFYVNPGQDSAAGALRPGGDCRERPGLPGAGGPGLVARGYPEPPGSPFALDRAPWESRACPETCGDGGRERKAKKYILKKKSKLCSKPLKKSKRVLFFTRNKIIGQPNGALLSGSPRE